MCCGEFNIVCEEDVLNQATVEFGDSQEQSMQKDSNIWIVRCTISSGSSCSVATGAVESKGVALASVSMLLISALVIGIRRLERKRNKK